MTINKNMIRERALKLPSVTDEMYNLCNKENRDMMEEFLQMNPQLSPATKRQYISGLKQFIYWIYSSCNDKPLYKIKKRDFNRYMSYLTNRGMSGSGLRFKKSSVSTLCAYIEDVIAEDDDFEEYKNFRNFTKAFKDIPKNHVYEKIPISKEEYEILKETLMDDENYMGLAWVVCAFNTGARRGGIRQFEISFVYQEIPEGRTFVNTNYVREKGKSDDGKRVRYMANEEVLKYCRLWLEKRGFESKYIFAKKFKDEVIQIGLEWADFFCSDTLSDILGRRINPHLFKASAITYLLEQGKDIKVVSKYVGQHNDISTTSNHYDLRDDSEEANKLFEK